MRTLGYIDNIEEGVEFSVKIEYADGIKEFSLKKSEYQETYVYYSDSEGSYRFNDEKDGSSSVMKFHLYGEPIADFGNKTAYIKYTSFNGTRNDLFGSVKQIQHVLDKFKADEKENLIFDLRGNGGGYLDIAQKLSAHFIDGEDGSKKLMSKAIYKDGTQYDFYSAKVDYLSYGFKNIIFLADAGSASASEVLIGSALDYDKRGIVKVVLARSGSAQGYTYKSYGKGIMQDTFPNVGKGDAIRLTVAKIYWPLSDICVHGVGITKSLIGEKCVEAEYGDGDYVLAAALGLLK